MSTGDAIQPRSAWAWLALLPLVVVLAAGARQGLAADVDVAYRWMLAALLSFEAALVAIAAHLSRRGSPRAWWPVLAAAVPALAGVVVYAGVGATLAGAMLALVALGLGTRFIGDGVRSPASALLVGLAMAAAVVSWLLPFPVHQRWAYLLLAALVIAWRARALATLLRGGAMSLRETASRHPAWAIVAIAATTVASLGLWLPSLNYDDNAVHLILQSQLLADGYYHLDVQSQSWAVAPWANNVLHAIAAMLAGHEARAAVASLWLLLGVGGAYRLARALEASPATALAAAAVFASQPLAGYFTTTMQVDGASAAILLHLAAMAVGPQRARLDAVAVGAIGGLLLALKTSNLIYLLPLLAWLIVSHARGGRLRWSALTLATLLLVGGSSYAYALLVTGNPLFPFYNGVFKSPYYPLENFRDLKWMTGVSWRSLWDLTFRTDSYGQFYPGAAGIALLALLPALLVDAARRPAPRWLLLWAFGSGWLVFHYMQYLRYIFPALSVLAVLGVVALARLADRRAFAIAVVAVLLANAALMPTTSWIARDNHWARLLREGPPARNAITRRVMPERVLLERVMAADPRACVLMTHPKKPFVGVGNGHALSMHRRYDPELWRARSAAEADASGAAWVRLLDRIGASHVVLVSDSTDNLSRALARKGYVSYASEGAIRVLESPDEAKCLAAPGSPRDQSARIGNIISGHLLGPGTTSVE